MPIGCAMYGVVTPLYSSAASDVYKRQVWRSDLGIGTLRISHLYIVTLAH